MITGIYEEIVTQLVKSKLENLDSSKFYIKQVPIDKAEASELLSLHLSQSIKYALSLLKGDNAIERQIEVANKIIHFLRDEMKNEEFNEDIIETEGKILKAVFEKVDSYFNDFDLHLKEITPYTRLTHSELFTGGNSDTTLESELRKEILSSDRIDLLVSFIKWKGIIILENSLRKFTEQGGKLRVITTTYMGATDYKAIKLLAALKNTEIKISYNTGNSIQLSTGSFNFEEMETLFRTLPVDITFVDKDDKVKFFSLGHDRIFTRNRAIIGRDVRMCHPPSSVHVVEQILSDFRNGTQNSAAFWISMQGKFIYIEYFAMRDKSGQYLGTIEFTQDLTNLRKLKGEQRLLSYTGK